ncbi:MAG: CotH kinase family protein [Bacteroidaceae bacterium]|nr:CotH kinase family protein [Bacteroidaceae bacterium]
MQLDITEGESKSVTCNYTGTKTLYWKSDNSEVASVTSNGSKTATITGVSEGSTVISVSTSNSSYDWNASKAYLYVVVASKPLTADDLTFEPTTVKNGKLATTTKWYLVTCRGKYLYADPEGLLLSAMMPTNDGTESLTNYLWALTGSVSKGFKFYNFDTDGSMVMGVMPEDKDGYPIFDHAQIGLFAPGSINEDYTTFRASRNGEGLTFTIWDEAYAGLNDCDSKSILSIWDNYKNLTDDGARFLFYEVDPAEFGGIDEADIIHTTGVSLNATTLTLAYGETHQLSATVLPVNATFKTVTWTSSNPTAVSVNSAGLITARAAGKSTITATTRDGHTASVVVSVTLNIYTDGLCINEVQASNVDQYLDPSYNYGGWVELYNSSSRQINLNGLFLTDTMDEPAQWPLSSLNLTYADYSENYSYSYNPYRETSSIVPAKGYSLIWFDHNDWRYPMMCPFKLDCDGATLYVTDGANVITECTYPESITRASWARTTDGGTTWGWTSEPTPGTKNSTSTFASQRLEAPSVDTDSRVFSNGRFNVSVTVPEGATLRYTLDGSTPSATHGETSGLGVFEISNTTILRVCAVQDGMITSPVVTRSYIKSTYTETLPVMSLVTEDGNLYDNEYGIMTRGYNGRPGLGQSSACNWNMDWDRPANIELLSKQGEMVFNQEANVAICGGWSRAYEPYSFKVKGKKQYEHMNYLPYHFFTAKPYIKNKTLQMRNGGNDNPANGGGGRFKDAALQTVILSSGLNIDGQSYEPVHLYRNGKYAGLINMREPNNRDYVYSNYGYDESEVDQFEMDCDSAYVQSSGDREAFERWYELARNCSDPEVYEQVKQICDVEEFINYMCVQSYLALADYGYNNVKGYRPRVDHGKFRFVLFDLDSASDSGSTFSWNANRYHNTQYEGTNGAKGAPRTNIEVEFITIFNNMLKNIEFRKQFVDQFCIFTGSVLEPERCAAVIDSLYNNVSYAANIEDTLIDKSYLSTSSIASTLKSSYFTTSRINSALSSMVNNNLLSTVTQSGRTTLTLTQSDPRGRLLLNDLPIPTGRLSGRVYAPATLRAEAPAGYKFVGWRVAEHKGDTGEEQTLVEEKSSWRYQAYSSLDQEDWTGTDYDDSYWFEGSAPLGYSKNVYVNTETPQGFPTTYFRKEATLSDKPASVTLNYRVDDGFAIYVNGQEAGRHNLPEGATYDTYTVSYANNYFEGSLTLDPELFSKGKNVIAVEVHNSSSTSSDLYWEASLTYTLPTTGGESSSTDDYVSTEPEYTLPLGRQAIEAVYEPLTAEEIALTDTHPVKVNEVSAGNSIYINDQYKKDDWVELYNTTSEDIDLTGYYLSDKADKPTKFQIGATSLKDGNILPAHGYRVVWCAKRDRTGRDIYSGFKLDNTDGCCVVLTSPDQSWSDTLTYRQMNGDETCGLYPDGSQNVYLMNMPTIAKSNLYTMYAAWYDEHDLELNPDLVGVREISHSNELGITYTAQGLLVTNEYMLATHVSVCNLAGQELLSVRPDMSMGRATISTHSLPEGVYVARATDAEGEMVSTKFVVR